MLQSTGLQRVGYDWVTEQQQQQCEMESEMMGFLFICVCIEEISALKSV